MIAALAAVLLALTFFAPGASFAPAYTSGHVEAEDRTGTKPTGKAVRDETVAPQHCDHSGGPAGPLRTRDRHRRAADSAPRTPERPLPRQDPAAVREPAPTHAHHAPRPSTAHSPAALQVFRC